MPKISAYPAGGAIQALDEFVIARTGANYKIRGASFMPASGYMVNGYISPVVAGNNLTLSLLTMAGTPPSATDPVYIRIGNGWRAVTAALSVTANAATNWMNLGGAELATKEADLFAYAGYNVTDGVVLGFARFPYADKYSDFSVTSTNEKYARISTILNATAGDQYSVIGRFAATLSAGAGYTWTQPASTFSNLIQRPIYETRWLTWTPVQTRTTTPYTGVPTVQLAEYKIGLQRLMANEQHTQNAVPGGSGNQQFTLPWTPSTQFHPIGIIVNQSVPSTQLCLSISGTPWTCRIYKYDGTAEVTAAQIYNANLAYHIA